MKTSIAIPKRLEKRPRYRGLPIPYIAYIKPDGQPDFRVIDQEKRHEVMLTNSCQLCNEPMGKFLFFVGGPEAASGNQYFEPPVHLDCLIYAMQVCPFILGRIEHADMGKVQAQNPEVLVGVDETYSSVRNPAWVIKKAVTYRFARTPGGTILLIPQGVLCTTDLLYPDKMGPEDWEIVKNKLMKGTNV